MANGLLTWVKSSYSGSQGGNCVEIAADHAHGRVLVRDTKDRDGAVLGFRALPWRRFAAEIKSQDRLGLDEIFEFCRGRPLSRASLLSLRWPDQG
jgi:hypothetical protein